ncbi:MAG: radical SAM protein [Magnetococcales bacterium]|nr:radical SAM protein [Magnetococcales bacterium]
MKTLLLNPVTDDGRRILRSERCQVKAVSFWPPIALAYCAAVVRAQRPGQELAIIDAEGEELNHGQMVERVVAAKPDVLVIQDTTATIAADLQSAARIKTRLPRTRTVFIGLHSTVRGAEVLARRDAVDFVIRNEPEYALAELVAALEDGHALTGIAGLSYMDGDHLVENPARQVNKALDLMPFPARDLLANDRYINPMTGKVFTLIKTSRGCPYQCVYCTAIPYYGRAWRARSVPNIIAEIKQVKEQHGIDDFLFHSDTFNLNRKFVFELCQCMIDERLEVSWMSNCRADLMDLEMARMMRAAGSRMVSFGIESGSDVMLQAMKKGLTTDQARRAVACCQEAGLQVIAYFVLGTPGETRQTMQQTLDFALELDPEVAQFFVATPFPGTEFYEQALRMGALTSDNWEDYMHGEADVFDYGDLSSKDFIAFKNHCYRRFYLRPGRILRTLSSNLSLLQSARGWGHIARFLRNRIFAGATPG